MSTYPEPPLWTNEEMAEFLLNNSLNEWEYRDNLKEVMALGIDPLGLNPDHLIQDDPWARPELHPDIVLARQSS